MDNHTMNNRNVEATMDGIANTPNAPDTSDTSDGDAVTSDGDVVKESVRRVVAVLNGALPGLLNTAVEQAVEKEMAGLWEAREALYAEIYDLRAALAEAVENGALEKLRGIVERSYTEHMARVLVEAGVGVGDYARIVRGAKARTESDG